MKYEIIALLDDYSNNLLNDLKFNLYRKYRFMKTSSSNYIHLSFINTSDLESLDDIITKVLSPYKKFKLNTQESSFYIDDLNKIVGLQLSNKGYLCQICRNLNEYICLSGLDSSLSSENFNMYIPFFYSNNRKCNLKNNNNYNLIDSNIELKVDKIAVVNTFNYKRSRNNSIKTYDLRDF